MSGRRMKEFRRAVFGDMSYREPKVYVNTAVRPKHMGLGASYIWTLKAGTLASWYAALKRSHRQGAI